MEEGGGREASAVVELLRTLACNSLWPSIQTLLIPRLRAFPERLA